MARWLEDLVDCTCPTPPVLVGNTLGGSIAARFASLRGERLAALVLVDTLGLAPFQPTPEFGAALNEYLSAPTTETLGRLWTECAFDLTALRRRLGDKWADLEAYTLDRVRAPGRLSALRSLMEHFGVPAIPPASLERITVPTALVWGRHDRATPLSVAREASRRYGWDLHVIDDAADEPAMDQPDAFVNVLRGVLDASLAREVAR
jgi:pimeloyl-ACP methyl ester carboxylesterase